MNKIFTYLIIAVFAMLSISCGGGKAIKSNFAPTADDELVFKSHDPKPKWIYSEPESNKKFHFFTGMSQKMAIEKIGRSDAYNNAIQNVVKYLGTAFEEKIQNLTTTYGLSSQILDPTQASRNFKEQLSKGLARKVKPREYYVERYKTALKESYYIVRLLTKVPKSSVEDAYSDQVDSEIQKMKERRDKAKDKKAKMQFEKAMDAFRKAKKDGFGLER